VARDAYKSEKRRKETARLKKQEEKRQRRFQAKTLKDGGDTEAVEEEGISEGQAVAADKDDVEGKEENATEQN